MQTQRVTKTDKAGFYWFFYLAKVLLYVMMFICNFEQIAKY